MSIRSPATRPGSRSRQATARLRGRDRGSSSSRSSRRRGGATGPVGRRSGPRPRRGCRGGSPWRVAYLPVVAMRGPGGRRLGSGPVGPMTPGRRIDAGDPMDGGRPATLGPCPRPTRASARSTPRPSSSSTASGCPAGCGTPSSRGCPGAFRVIALDLPGHGALRDRPFAWDEAVETIAAVVEEAAGGRAIVAGLSLGGYLAMDLAIRQTRAGDRAGRLGRLGGAPRAAPADGDPIPRPGDGGDLHRRDSSS